MTNNYFVTVFYMLFFLYFFLAFIFHVSLCTSVLRHLAVCNTAESVLCWCVLTTSISGPSFLSTYSTSFVHLLLLLLLLLLLFTTFIQSILNYIPETNHVSMVYPFCSYNL
jgi:hypothetical protein